MSLYFDLNYRNLLVTCFHMYVEFCQFPNIETIGPLGIWQLVTFQLNSPGTIAPWYQKRSSVTRSCIIRSDLYMTIKLSVLSLYLLDCSVFSTV